MESHIIRDSHTMESPNMKEVMKHLNRAKTEVGKIPNWLPISLVYRDPRTGEIIDFGNCNSYIDALRLQEDYVRAHPDFER